MYLFIHKPFARIWFACYSLIVLALINPSLVSNSAVIFALVVVMIALRILYLSSSSKKYQLETKILLIPIFLAVVYVLGAFKDSAPDYLYRLMFVSSPAFIAAALYYLTSSEDRFALFVRATMIAVVVLAISQITQYFFFPHFFGFVQHPIYSGDLIGTSSFRAIGLGGSPQNNAMILSLGLFLTPTINSPFYRILYLTLIITAGFMTLATFFGVCFIIFILTRHLSLLAFAPIAMLLLTTLPVENTPFESLNFIEIREVADRVLIPEDRGLGEKVTIYSIFFGFDIGIATSGLIDMGYFKKNNFNHESWLMGRVIETGLLGCLFFLWVLFTLFIFFLKNITNRSREAKILCGLTIGLMLAAFVTPNFESPRVSVFFWLIFFIILDFKKFEKKGTFEHNNKKTYVRAARCD